MDEPVERPDEVEIEDALRQFERLFEQFADAVQEIIAITTADGRENLYLNRAFDLITGASRERVLADPQAFLELVHPEDRGLLYEAFEHRHRVHEYSYRIIRPGGEERWIHARAFPIHGPSGELERIATIARDVTDAKRAEERLASQRATLAGVAGSLTALLTAGDSDASIDDALRVLAEGVGVDRVYVARHDRHPTGEVDIRITHDWTREGAGLVFAADGRSVVRVPEEQMPLFDRVESGRPLALKRSELPPDRLSVAGGMSSLLMVPVMDSTGCWGHVGLVDAEEEHDWPDEIRRILETAAAALGNAIARRRTLHELEAQVERTSALYAALANPTIPVADQVQKALATIARLLDMDEASLVRVPDDPESEHTEVAWVHPPDGPTQAGLRVPFDPAAFRQSVAGDEPTAVADFEGSPLAGHPVHAMGFRSFFGFPVWVRGKLWGGLALLSRRPREQPFRRTDADLLRLVARGVGFMLEQLEAEKQQRVYEERFRETQRLESLGVLAGGIAHDFNNLLMGIMGNASLALLEADGSPQLSEPIEQIVTASKRASELTRQMLAYAGKGSFRVAPVRLQALVGEMGGLLDTVLPADARIEYALDADLPPVLGDPSQLQQVVMNLITNAADAIGGSGGRVRVATGLEDAGGEPPSGRLVSDDAPPGPYVFVEVEDDGVGMDEETIDRIFEPFFTTKFAGRGLGLAAVLGIVRSHRGALRVRSEPGRGTTFRVLFPAATEVGDVESSEEGASIATVRRVLVVDDTPQVRDTVRRLLEWHGVEVLEAVDGQGAVRIVRERGDDLDAVVLDLTMPRLDGIGAHGSIRELRPELPIVVMSGYAEDEAVREVTRHPHTVFLQKPFRSADLVARMAEVVAG